MNLNWLTPKWLKKWGKKDIPGEDVPVGPPGAFSPPKKRRPYVTASKATSIQPRRYQDRSKYGGPQWDCIMCGYYNEGVICTHCFYVPENEKIPVPMGGITVLEKVRGWFGG